MADGQMRQLVAEQRRRCIATILGFCEGADWWGALEKDEQVGLRATVLRAVATLYDVTLDVLKVSGGDGVTNACVIDMIEAIHRKIVVRPL
jgi:hypothetical protein